MENRLGMTEEQMITEIEFMRDWEDFMKEALGEEHYVMLCQAYARKRTENELKSLGASEEEIKDIIERTDKALGWSTEIQ